MAIFCPLMVSIAQKRMKVFACIALKIVFLCSTPLIADISVIVPNSLADVEGDQSTHEDAEFPNGLRIQVIYPANQFGDLPEEGAWLTEIRFRPDEFVTSARTHSFDRWYFRVSTTQAEPESISQSFSDNIGLDELVIYDRPITLSTSADGPTNGPRPFDYKIPFDIPFFYDPDEGNLLTDNTQTSGRWIRPDGDVGVLGQRSVVSLDPESPDGQLFSTSVAEFVFVSELLPGDFNADGLVNVVDIDLLARATRLGRLNSIFDVDGSGMVDQNDMDFQVANVIGTWRGDSS